MEDISPAERQAKFDARVKEMNGWMDAKAQEIAKMTAEERRAEALKLWTPEQCKFASWIVLVSIY
jgi:hypothetical protein